jgi:hypothetical protein
MNQLDNFSAIQPQFYQDPFSDMNSTMAMMDPSMMPGMMPQYENNNPLNTMANEPFMQESQPQHGLPSLTATDADADDGASADDNGSTTDGDAYFFCEGGHHCCRQQDESLRLFLLHDYLLIRRMPDLSFVLYVLYVVEEDGIPKILTKYIVLSVYRSVPAKQPILHPSLIDSLR